MRPFLHDADGSIPIVVAVLLPGLMGFAAFGVDVGNAYYNQNRLKIAADAAALGAVLAMPDTTAATSRAVALAAKNVPAGSGTVTAAGDVTFGTYDPAAKTFTVSASNQSAVRVTAKRTAANSNALQTFFAGFLGKPSLDLSATSVAVRVSPSCLLVLNPSVSEAFYQQGSADVRLQGCALHVNSTSATALVTQGSTTTKASSICVAGGYTGSGFTPAPVPGCAPLADPLADLPEPAEPPCTDHNVSLDGGQLASNCTYTGNVSFKKTNTLQPGLFYFKGATVSLSGNASVNGQGVTFFLDKTSRLDLGGNGSLSLSAPTSGTYAGIAIFQSDQAALSVTHTLRGTSDLSVDGTIYLPTSTLSMAGSGSVSNPAKLGRVIVGRMSLQGSPAFSINAFANGSSLAGSTNGRTALVD